MRQAQYWCYLLLSLLCVEIVVAELQPDGFHAIPSLFRDKQVLQHEDGFQTLVQLKEVEDPRSVYELMKRMEENHRRGAELSPPRFALPPVPDHFFRFIPAYVTALLPANKEPFAYSAPCFNKTDFSIQYTEGEETAEVTVELSDPRSETCGDFYLFATPESFYLHKFEFRGTHTIKWTGLSTNFIEDFVKNGLRVFQFEDGVDVTLADIYDTVRLFLGGIGNGKHAKVPPEMEEENLKFLREYMGVEMPPRTHTEPIFLNESLIHSGDFLGIIRLDGLDPMIAYGMGSRTGHTTSPLWIDGELYVTESQDAWYWPTKNIQRTPWKQWIQQAHDASFNVVWVPLKEEARAQWNNDAAVEFFEHSAGLSYGFPNFLWGWIDTPNANFPPPVSQQFLMTGFAVFDRLDSTSTNLIWNEALNHRLGTFGLSTLELYQTILDRNMTFAEVITIPEQDDWVYSTGKAMVCDVYIVELYKAAGLFGSIVDDIQGSEFTNPDLYTLEFLDPAPKRPTVCEEADPSNPFCQITGNYALTLDDATHKVGSIKPFPHMREHCPGEPPLYEKPANC